MSQRSPAHKFSALLQQLPARLLCTHTQTHIDGILMKRRDCIILAPASSHRQRICVGCSEETVCCRSYNFSYRSPTSSWQQQRIFIHKHSFSFCFQKEGHIIHAPGFPLVKTPFFFASQGLCKEMQAGTASKYEKSAPSIPPGQKCFGPLMKLGVGC